MQDASLTVPPGQRVGVCFGGPSVEHDVSIISAQQLMAALSQRHHPIPIYLGRDGRFWTGDSLRTIEAFADDPPNEAIPCELRLGCAKGSGFVRPSSSRLRADEPVRLDAVVCAIHGTGGEDGALLGALEHTSLPYVGGGVGPAAAAMNKATGKAIFRNAGIEVNADIVVGRSEFAKNSNAIVDRAVHKIGLPCFVKPASLGSSIGVSRCANTDDLREAFELGFELDRAVLVEPALDDAIEINCAILGRYDGKVQISVCEQPIKSEKSLLSFEEKYLSGAKGKNQAGMKTTDAGMASQDRLIPAPISDELTQAIQETACKAHRALGFAGVARYDFLVPDLDDTGRVILNEANTVPGSFSFYLFEPMGIGFPEMADTLIEIAFAEAAERRATTTIFESILLETHTASKEFTT